MRCEYCRQITDGVECRRCGAPLPFDARGQVRKMWEEANIAGSLEYSRMMHNDIEVIIPDGVEVDYDAPGGALHNYSRRNNTNNAIALAQGNLYSKERIRELLLRDDWAIPPSEEWRA